MAVPEALENQQLTALLEILEGIGVPADSWLTEPDVLEGVPGDAVPSVATTPVVYLQHLRTDQAPAEAGTSSHYWRAHFKVWLMAKTPRIVVSLKADVLRALFAAEDSLTTSFGQPAYADSFAHRDDMSSAGTAVGELTIYLDFEMSHTAP